MANSTDPLVYINLKIDETLHVLDDNEKHLSTLEKESFKYRQKYLWWKPKDITQMICKTLHMILFTWVTLGCITLVIFSKQSVFTSLCMIGAVDIVFTAFQRIINFKTKIGDKYETQYNTRLQWIDTHQKNRREAILSLSGYETQKQKILKDI
jgi:hypothetical protein